MIRTLALAACAAGFLAAQPRPGDDSPIIRAMRSEM